MDWSLYEKRMNINGGTPREQTINLEKEVIENKIVGSPAFKTVLINDVELGIVVHSTKKPNEKTFNTLPNQTDMVNIGDIVLWEKMHWLITEVDFDDEITRSGKMVQCNRIIKWQNPISKEIISRWCFAERPYANGIKDGEVISVPDRQFRIKLPYDKETMLVDIDRRFMLETINGKPKTYHLLMPDLITSRFADSEGGFIVWNLEFDTEARTDKDNVELGVCDYHAPDSTIPPVDPDPTLLKCEIIGSSVIKLGGSARTYNAIFYQADGITPDEAIAAVWAVDVSPKYADKIISASNGNSISLSCMDDIDMLDVKIELSLSDDFGLYEAGKKNVEVVSAI